jgi:hypothetical protein
MKKQEQNKNRPCLQVKIVKLGSATMLTLGGRGNIVEAPSRQGDRMW